MITATPLSKEVRRDLGLHCGCLAGVFAVDDPRPALDQSVFVSVQIQQKGESREFIKNWAPGLQLEEAVVSALIEAAKP